MCAQIYPIKEDLSEMPYSEFQVYEMLEKLDEKFVVFHSVQWIKKVTNGNRLGKKMIS